MQGFINIWNTKRYWALGETRTTNTLTLNLSKYEWPALCTVHEYLKRAEARSQLTLLS